MIENGLGGLREETDGENLSYQYCKMGLVDSEKKLIERICAISIPFLWQMKTFTIVFITTSRMFSKDAINLKIIFLYHFIYGNSESEIFSVEISRKQNQNNVTGMQSSFSQFSFTKRE